MENFTQNTDNQSETTNQTENTCPESLKSSILEEFDNALSFVDERRKTKVKKKEKSKKSFDTSKLKVFREISNEIVELKTQIQNLDDKQANASDMVQDSSDKQLEISEEPSIFERASEQLNVQIMDYRLQAIDTNDEPSIFEKASEQLNVQTMDYKLQAVDTNDEPSIFEKASEQLCSQATAICVLEENKSTVTPVHCPQSVNWHPCIQGIIRSELASTLADFNIKSCNINYGPEPKIFASGEEIFMCLTPTSLEKVSRCVPQLRSLLLQKGFTSKNVEDLKIDNEMLWDYSKELDLHIPVSENVLAPSYTKSTLMYLSLINSLKDELKGKRVLEIGSGCGILTTHLARLGATVVAIDNSQEAIKNTMLTISLESDEIQQRITVGESDIYSNINEITNEEDPTFDFVIFNNPLLKGTASDELGKSCYAGNDFDIPIRAINGLPKILKKGGKGYFLVASVQEENNFLSSFLGQEKISDHYFNTKLLSKISRFIKPKINIDTTDLVCTVSYEPVIDYVISKISLC